MSRAHASTAPHAPGPMPSKEGVTWWARRQTQQACRSERRGAARQRRGPRGGAVDVLDFAAAPGSGARASAPGSIARLGTTPVGGSRPTESAAQAKPRWRTPPRGAAATAATATPSAPYAGPPRGREPSQGGRHHAREPRFAGDCRRHDAPELRAASVWANTAARAPVIRSVGNPLRTGAPMRDAVPTSQALLVPNAAGPRMIWRPGTDSFQAPSGKALHV